MGSLRIPFSFYDFFGNIFPGFILLMIIYWILVPENTYEKLFHFFDVTKDFKYIITFVILLVSYGLGHVVSHIGSYIFEKIVIRKWLKYPSYNLFNPDQKYRFFKDYKRSYSKEFITAFSKNFEKIFGKYGDYDMFMLCFTTVKEKCSTSFERLTVFISLYGFSRNSSTAFLILTIVLLIKGYLLYSGISLLIAYVFFLRFLKFYRIYADEVFRTFYVYTSKF